MPPRPAPTRLPALVPLRALAAGAALAAILGGCADPGPDRHGGPRGSSVVHPENGGPGSGDDGPGLADPSALIPERLRIHPLTRFTESEEGEVQLALHLELKDRFGHSTKCLGRLYVELVRPREGGIDPTLPAPGVPPGAAGDGPAPDGRATDVYWDVDLRDPETNALMYDDLISRTYLIYLGGLPGWAEMWARGDNGAALDDSLTLRATFYPAPFNGEPAPPALRATYRLER